MNKNLAEASEADSTARPDVITSISNPTILPISIPSTTTSSTVLEDDGNDKDENHYDYNSSDDHYDYDSVYASEDEEDEIVREIDVYISPELAKTMNLIQFPLHPASHTTIPTNRPINNNNKRQPLTQADPPFPNAARIKPEHTLLELDYSVPSYSFSNQRSVPEVLDLSTRTHISNDIPMVTHMALGLFDNTGTKIDLVPLHRILQMRPSFIHIDAVFDDDDLLNQQAQAAESNKKKDVNAPIMIKKAESERTIQMRESSYAFKRSEEMKEEWLTLDVHGSNSAQRREALRKFACPRDRRDVNLKFVKPGNVGGGVGYVKSLNYLPNINMEEDAEEDFLKPVAGVLEEEDVVVVGGNNYDEEEEDNDDVNVAMEEEEEETESMFQKELTDRIAKLLQGRGGVPIPYPVIRTRYHASVTDEDLLQAISASAAMVRGNFLLKSSLLGLTSPHVANARDLILILLNKYGFVQQDKLAAVYASLDERDDIAKIIVTQDILGALLDLVGRKTLNGVELKVDDDPTMEADFGEITKMHSEYWKRKEDLLAEYVVLYEDQM